MLKNYTDEDVAEVLLPKFAQQVSLWDFFISKVSKEPGVLSIFDMLREFEKFITLLRQETHNCLSPVNVQDNQGKTVINVNYFIISFTLPFCEPAHYYYFVH